MTYIFYLWTFAGRTTIMDSYKRGNRVFCVAFARWEALLFFSGYLKLSRKNGILKYVEGPKGVVACQREEEAAFRW